MNSFTFKRGGEFVATAREFLSIPNLQLSASDPEESEAMLKLAHIVNQFEPIKTVEKE